MGKQNRQRRAAKAKKRAKRRDQRHPSSSPGAHGPARAASSERSAQGSGWVADRPWVYDSPFVTVEQVRSYLHALAVDIARGDASGVDRSMAVLARTEPRLVRRAAEGELLAIVATLWGNGWQPSELVRHARRASTRGGRLVALAVAADHAMRAPATLHPRWAAQLDDLTLPSIRGTGWLAGFAAGEGLDVVHLLELVVDVLVCCGSVGALPTIIPPPGATACAAGDAAAWHDRTPDGIDDAVLRKIRALLAQAESTTYEAEAITFTAKAQELMARHAVDAAVAWSKGERQERPITIRLPIDDPYADVKSWLVGVVAMHSRCRAVYHSAYSLSSVIGFAGDIASAEMLFTSLLVQSQIALQAEGATEGPGGRTRTRSFRSSFLMAYVHRIDARLGEINAAVESDAAASQSTPGSDDTVPSSDVGSLLPALAERRHVVDDEVASMFGDLTHGRIRGGDDWLGWERGTLAADRAQLNTADLSA